MAEAQAPSGAQSMLLLFLAMEGMLPSSFHQLPAIRGAVPAPHARGRDATTQPAPCWRELTLAPSHGALVVPVPRVYRSLRRCLNIFPFQKTGSRLCHFHLCVAEGIFANAAEAAATSQRDAASLCTPLLFQGRTGVSFISLQVPSTPREREERAEHFQKPPEAPQPRVPWHLLQEAFLGS